MTIEPPATTGARVAVSGSHASAHTGAAVVHAGIAASLPAQLPGVDVFDDFRVGDPFARRLIGRRDVARASVTVCTSTPTPLRPIRAVVPFVYDVRWRWTRRGLARAYRHADLLLGWRRAHDLLTISTTVKEHLRAMLGVDGDRIHVIDLGPGQMAGLEPAPVTDRAPCIVLVGDAPHKRNELAAELLAAIPTVAEHYRIVAISVSAATKRTLSDRFSPSQLDLVDGVGRDRLAALLRDGSVYVALSLSEGFGFPYIEAAYMGCDVVAPRQAVTSELLGDDAVLLSSSTPTADELAAALDAFDLRRVERLQGRATRRSWDVAAAQVAEVILRRLEEQ